MSQVPTALRYTQTHEWAQKQSDGAINVGVTDHAQDLLGDMVYVELPELGRVVKAKEECAVVESVKAASDVYSPISGEIIAVNNTLKDTPELVNKDPYGEGWLFRVRPSAGSDYDKLLTAAAYEEVAKKDEH